MGSDTLYGVCGLLCSCYLISINNFNYEKAPLILHTWPLENFVIYIKSIHVVFEGIHLRKGLSLFLKVWYFLTIWVSDFLNFINFQKITGVIHLWCEF